MELVGVFVRSRTRLIPAMVFREHYALVVVLVCYLKISPCNKMYYLLTRKILGQMFLVFYTLNLMVCHKFHTCIKMHLLKQLCYFSSFRQVF